MGRVEGGQAEEVLLTGESAGQHEEEDWLPLQGSQQNLTALSLLLALALTTNTAAAPVILFRRTRFGNGQFACLILCLTLCDLVTVVTGLVGGLVLELANLSWAGSSQGCAAYYFISSWLVGLSNYLVSCLVCLLLVKRGAGVLARLQECRLLLLCLTLLSLLPALPELAIHSTISDPELGFSVCILTAPPHAYNLYVTVKLALRHLLPAASILLATLRPRTTAARRISLVFLGQPAVCECGSGGAALSTPHECPGMTRSARQAPDLLRDTETCGASLVQHHTKPRPASHGLPALLEDPVRRTYKRLLAISFLATATTYLLVDLSYQIQSAVTSSFLTSSASVMMEELGESRHERNLGTALYTTLFLQQIINPLIFLYSEFLAK